MGQDVWEDLERVGRNVRFVIPVTTMLFIFPGIVDRKGNLEFVGRRM